MPEYTITRPALLKFVQNGSGFIHLRLGLAALFCCPRICRNHMPRFVTTGIFRLSLSDSLKVSVRYIHVVKNWFGGTTNPIFLRIQNSKKPPFRLAIEFFSKYPFLSKDVYHVTFMSCLLRGIKFFFVDFLFKW